MDESNIAAFVEMAQQFGSLNIGVGLRYEHVKFDYYETGRLRDGQSKTYNNLFPSLNVAAQTGPVRMGLNYSGKTVRPGYGQLDGAVSYINRLTFETGNPYLKPTKMQTVEYMTQWRQFFAQLSYTYFKDGVYHITEPYGADGEATIIRTANLDHRHYYLVRLTTCMVLPSLSSKFSLRFSLSAVRTENPGELLQNTVPSISSGVRVREPDVLTT